LEKTEGLFMRHAPQDKLRQECGTALILKPLIRPSATSTRSFSPPRGEKVPEGRKGKCATTSSSTSTAASIALVGRKCSPPSRTGCGTTPARPEPRSSAKKGIAARA